MKTQITESVWLNASDICSFEHVVEVSGLSPQELHALIDTGVIEPSNDDPGNYFFHMQCIVVARKARRLRDDFELDTQGLAVALNLLRRVGDLEAEIADLRARLVSSRRP
ncbi:MAG TPA: chaperone modulator CbpM [Pusillimonas sp.]|uniref:chaperone modulator CbpM n=1 Tax=Pusillimonas sp. TaxID=3040095 RepID=UPI002BE9A1BB|nr:chaperone modulator CbpM [Pusillimonas sp.]HUH87720.1 chaperone modulator CbpM [Pusillimonas sp.]